MALITTSTGCSKTTVDKEFIPTPTILRFSPVKPAVLVLEDEAFVICPNEKPDEFVCITPDDARKIIRNKTKMAKFIGEAGAVIRFQSGSSVPGPSQLN